VRFTAALAAAQQVVARCRELATVSEECGRLTRPFASPAMARANALVGRWMQDAGLAVRTDAAGNLVGRRAGADPGAGTLLVGSHLDTVRDAGAFDGPLGVLVAVAALEALGRNGVTLPYAVDVLGFSDEEGLRFGTAYLGSRAVAGTFDPALLDLVDERGVSVAQALTAFGGAPDAIDGAARRGERLRGYVEVHIEQGPVLEREDAPVAVVTAIAGATRAEVRFAGEAGHAGTVPMRARRDAAAAAAEWLLAVERTGLARPGLLATVGRLTTLPGATNVIPAGAVASLDVRHAEDTVRDAAVAGLRAEAQAIGARRGVEVAWRTTLENAAVDMDPGLTAALAGAVARCGHRDLRLASGAGHDGVALSALTGVAMLFVRCTGGLSHHPAEAVAVADVAVALVVLRALLEDLA
jgi:allantoate deiminase